MSQDAGDRQGRRAWVGTRDAAASNRPWLPVVALALVLSVVRPARQGPLVLVHVTPWFVLVAAVAALPFALNPLVRRRKPNTTSLIGGSLRRTPPPAFEPDRGWAVAWLVAPFVAAIVGGWLYRAHAPSELDVLAVELGGSAQAFPPAGDLGLALMWDFAFIVGYGTALWMGVVAASWVFWTPRAAGLARFGTLSVVVVAAADLLENVLLAWAWRGGWGWSFALDAASVSARVKFAMLLPTVVIALAGVIIATARLISSRFRVERKAADWSWVPEDQLRVPEPLEVMPPATPREGGTLTAVPEHSAQEDAGEPSPGAEQRRWTAAYEVPDVVVDGNAVGFCLSGGGVRSACVSLGVLQVLRDQLQRARYVVSVSGGGYTAGALTQLLSEPPREWLPPGATVQGDLRTAYAPGSVELDHLRRHSSYISSNPSEMVVALGVLARGLLASLALLFAPAILLGIAVAWLYHAFPIAVLPQLRGGDETSSTGAPTVRSAGDTFFIPPQAVWTGVVVTSLAVLAWLYQVWWQNRNLAEVRHGYARALRARSAAVFATRAALIVVVAVLGLPSLLWVSGWVADKAIPHIRLGIGGAVGSVLLSYVASLAALLWRRRTTITGALKGRKGKDTTGATTAAVPHGLVQLLLVVLALAALYGGWLLLFGISASATVGPLTACDPSPPLATCDQTSPLVTAAVLAVVVVALGGILDESSLSLHPFYRQRLATAFATRRVTIDGSAPVAVPYGPRELTTLSKYTGSSGGRTAPTFVFCAAANVNAQHRTPPGLNAVSFTFTSDWCGSPDVGWVRTETLEKVSPPRLRRDVTVQGAVAISGAAIASAMGRASGWYELLLAISGARLGAWLPNPSFLAQMREARSVEGKVQDWTLPGLPRVRRLTYLLREVLNQHPDSDRLLLISDGGHWENLGLVEALRRRCTTIFVADGGGDRPPTAQGLVEAIDLAYAELGVTITLNDPLASEPGAADPLKPETPLQALNAALSRTPVITGTFTYPEAAGLPPDRRTGRLYVARSSLWPTMPYSLLSYAAQHPEFPRDSTSDQWFDDGQFTAYTDLGRAMGEEVLKVLAADAPAAQEAGRNPVVDTPTGWIVEQAQGVGHDQPLRPPDHAPGATAGAPPPSTTAQRAPELPDLP